MESLEPFTAGYIAMLVAKALWTITWSVVVIIAAQQLWNCVPRWIPSVFIANTVTVIIAAAPFWLLQANQISLEQYGKLIIPLYPLSSIAGGASAVAMLRLAIHVRRKTEQAHSHVGP